MTTSIEAEEAIKNVRKQVEVSETLVENDSERNMAEQFHTVLACLDSSYESKNVIPFGQLLAKALHTDLLLANVLELDLHYDAPFDPAALSLRRQKAAMYIDGLVKEYQPDSERTDIEVLEGEPDTTVDGFLSHLQREITVFCRKDVWYSSHIESTARKHIEHSAGSIFLIPAKHTTPNSAGFQRIMVPLDGSSQAETVLPTISCISRFCNAAVFLVYAVPTPDVIQLMPGELRSENLRSALTEHNRSTAQLYLDRIAKRLSATGDIVETRVVSGSDVRRRLLATTKEEKIDLVVLSAYGASGHDDVPLGNVASYIMSHTPVPTLMLRDSG